MDSRLRRERGSSFFDDRGFEQFSFAGARKSAPNFRKTEVDNFLAGFLQQIIRGADDKLEVLASIGRLPCPVRTAIRTA